MYQDYEKSLDELIESGMWELEDGKFEMNGLAKGLKLMHVFGTRIDENTLHVDIKVDLNNDGKLVTIVDKDYEVELDD